jgi:hypothetical protein
MGIYIVDQVAVICRLNRLLVSNHKISVDKLISRQHCIFMHDPKSPTNSEGCVEVATF